MPSAAGNVLSGRHGRASDRAGKIVPVGPARGTGATISFVPTEVLANLGIAVRWPEGESETASGAVIRRRLGVASLAVDGHETITPVIFGELGDAAVLGAVALESLGLIVDPMARRLAPRRFLALRIN